jgi:hypothetical protein
MFMFLALISGNPLGILIFLVASISTLALILNILDGVLNFNPSTSCGGLFKQMPLEKHLVKGYVKPKTTASPMVPKPRPIVADCDVLPDVRDGLSL